MNHVDITSLHQEVLHGKTETAVLFGFPWAELEPDDEMVRLLLVPEDRDKLAFQAFFHRLTPLKFYPGRHGRRQRHVSAEALDIQDEEFRVYYQGDAYQIANRMSASWSYFGETHGF